MAVISIGVAAGALYPDGKCTNSSWKVFQIDLFEATPLGALTYMCVDEGNGYVPGETWLNRAGMSCVCSSSVEPDCR